MDISHPVRGLSSFRSCWQRSAILMVRRSRRESSGLVARMRRRDDGSRQKGVERSARSGNRAMSPTRVLVIEDDAIIGMFLGEMLADLGYEVCAIEATEDEAVAAADRCRPGLMIVD